MTRPVVVVEDEYRNDERMMNLIILAWYVVGSVLLVFFGCFEVLGKRCLFLRKHGRMTCQRNSKNHQEVYVALPVVWLSG